MDRLPHIKEAAAEWLARRGGEKWTTEDDAALERWLKASVRHQVEFLSLENRWRTADRLKVIAAGLKSSDGLAAWDASPYFERLKDREESSRQTNVQLIPVHQRHVSVRAVVVAAGVTMAVIGLAWHWWPDGKAYSTAVGVTAAVPLPDGSRITLNTDSAIRVALSEQERRVTLKQGEAFFEVESDPRTPFVVNAADKRIVVLGTKFSVWRRGPDVRVVVTEGKVEVRDARTASTKASPVALDAGAIAESRGRAVEVQERSLPRAEELLSWRSGYLDFDEVPLVEAVAELNRYNARKFVIQDPSIEKVRVSGHFRATNVEPFARLLEKGFPVSVTRLDEVIVLSAR